LQTINQVQHRHFLNLDVGLPGAQLVEPLHACLRGEGRQLTLDATNRRGRAIRCHVTCMSLDMVRSDRAGVMLLMEVLPRQEGPASD
jgi:two-component system CheB/CheR fusion protein